MRDLVCNFLDLPVLLSYFFCTLFCTEPCFFFSAYHQPLLLDFLLNIWPGMRNSRLEYSGQILEQVPFVVMQPVSHGVV